MMDYKTDGMILQSDSGSNEDLSSPSVWLKLLVMCGGMGLVTSGPALADTLDVPDADAKIYTSAELLRPVDRSMPAVAPSARPAYQPPAAPAPSPAFSTLRTSPSISLTSPASGQASMHIPPSAPPPTSIVAQAPAASAEMREALQPSTPMGETLPPSSPTPSAPTSPAPASSINPSELIPSQLAADETVPPGYNSVFIDPTDYSVGATKAPNAPSLVFAERSSGCQITVNSGQSVPNQTCNTVATAANNNSQEIKAGPLTIGSQGVTLGGTTIISREALNERIRPLNVLRRGNEDYIFPLSIPAPISSVFGWRVHPILQTWRFHSGDDLAAPIGTPVLATRDGRVTVADFLGGYGLTVILRHDDNKLESRYGHLSQIAVKPGEWVKQGEVIGLVGSTGNSTGPHLHFEMRQLTTQGWVAVDPQEVLQYGIANLLKIIDNPMVALGQGADGENAAEAEISPDLPFRPAQPNAS